MDSAPIAIGRPRVPRALIIALIVVELIGGAVLVYLLLRPRTTAAVALSVPVDKLVEASILPEAQKRHITADVDQLITDTREGRISFDQFQQIDERLFQGPFMDLLQTEMVRVQATKLFESDTKRQQRALLTIDRFERGLREGKFSEDQIGSVMAKIGRSNDKKRRAVRNPVTDGEVKKFITAAGLLVEAMKIPTKPPYRADLAAEFRRTIVDVLGPVTASGLGAEYVTTQPEEVLTPPIEAKPAPITLPKASKAPVRSSKSPSSSGGTRRSSTPRTQRPR